MTGTGAVHADVWGALPLPALMLDGGDRILRANAASEDWLNRSAKGVVGRPLAALVDPDGGIAAGAARVRANTATLRLHDAAIGVRGDGGPRRTELHLAPLDGDAVLVLIVPQDLAGRLDRARTSRSAARSVIGMAEMLAHEIKNPLAGITGAAQLLASTLDGDDRDLTDLIVVEARRIVKLLEQVERFGDLRPPERRAVNVHDILDRARRSAMVGAAAHMEISEAYDPSLPPAWVDHDQMLQAVSNLIVNAAQVGGQGGRILLRTFYETGLHLRGPEGGGAVPLQIEIVDDGPGVPADLLPNLFEPFVSGRENGTGLGLALVAKIVSANDGLVAVESRPGRTAFRLSLPRVPKNDVQPPE